MSEAKFTKGPWEWGADRLYSGDEWVASPELDSNSGWAYIEICDEDKSLIAAAPDLYEALDKAVNLMIETRTPSNHSVVVLARQALAKARGEK